MMWPYILLIVGSENLIDCLHKIFWSHNVSSNRLMKVIVLLTLLVLVAAVAYGFCSTPCPSGLEMERANRFSQQYVILSRTFLSATTAVGIFMRCLQGKYHNFIICCCQVFYLYNIWLWSACSVSVPFNRTRDLSMWLWRAHNKVNERLNKEEKALGTGDPRFPKIIWPPKQLCRSCYVSSSRKRRSNMKIYWNEDEVYKFLVRYYGRTLASSHNDATLSGKYDESYDITTSTNAVAVPVGAALAIAVASCTFGALACFWRAQQKNRKYTHQLHSFKDIWLVGC